MFTHARLDRDVLSKQILQIWLSKRLKYIVEFLDETPEPSSQPNPAMGRFDSFIVKRNQKAVIAHQKQNCKRAKKFVAELLPSLQTFMRELKELKRLYKSNTLEAGLTYNHPEQQLDDIGAKRKSSIDQLSIECKNNKQIFLSTLVNKLYVEFYSVLDKKCRWHVGTMFATTHGTARLKYIEYLNDHQEKNDYLRLLGITLNEIYQQFPIFDIAKDDKLSLIMNPDFYHIETLKEALVRLGVNNNVMERDRREDHMVMMETLTP